MIESITIAKNRHYKNLNFEGIKKKINYLQEKKKLIHIINSINAEAACNFDIGELNREISKLESLREFNHKTFYSNGEKRSLCQMKDGLANGNLTIWQPSGAVKSKNTMINGILYKSKNWHFNEDLFFTMEISKLGGDTFLYIKNKKIIHSVVDIKKDTRTVTLFDDNNTYGCKNLKISLNRELEPFFCQKVKIFLNIKRLSIIISKKNRENLTTQIIKIGNYLGSSCEEIKQLSKF